jgi:TusA-related sulfurtransferase
MPIIKTAEKIKELQIGQVLEIIATDEGIKSDMPAWCKATGQEYLGTEEQNNEYRCYVKRLK